MIPSWWPLHVVITPVPVTKGASCQELVCPRACALPDSSYAWGSNHWKMTTWNKVHVSRHVYGMGFHVVQSDGDVVWFRDPMPYFSQYFDGPAHL